MKNHSILSKILLFLVLASGWGGNIWGQTTQLPIASGLYEILNISNDGGTGTGRGYLINYSIHSSGLGLADVSWQQYRGIHPTDRHNDNTTCSYWYLHNHGDGTYTLVSISPLGNSNSTPRFLRVGNNQGLSNLVNDEVLLVFKDATKASHNRDGKKAVIIANKSAENVYLSGACGTNSNNGSVKATTTATDGGNPWLFVPLTEDEVSTEHLAIRNKYLERFTSLPDNVTLVFKDTEGNTIPATYTSKLAKYTPADGDAVEFTATSTSYNFGNVLFDKNRFGDTFNYNLVDLEYDKENTTLTFTVSLKKWYTLKLGNTNSYLSSDYADDSGKLMLRNDQPVPTTYGGFWRLNETGNPAANSDGTNVNLYNAKYYDTKLLASNTGTGSARAAMYAHNEVPANHYTEFERRNRGATSVFRIVYNGTSYISRNNGTQHVSVWDSGSGYTDNNSQYTIVEVPAMGEDVKLVFNNPDNVVIKYNNTECLPMAGQADMTNVELNGRDSYNFHNMPYLASFFSLGSMSDSKELSVAFDNGTQTMTFTVRDRKWYRIKGHRVVNGYLSVSATGLDAGTEQMKWGTSDAAANTAAEYWTFVGDDASGYMLVNKAYGIDYAMGLEGTGTGSRARMYHISDPNALSIRFDKVPSTHAQCVGEFCLMLHGNHNVALHDYSSQLKVWNTDENAHKTDTGSAFAITEVSADIIAACEDYTVYRVELASGSASIEYNGAAQNLIGLQTVPSGRYMLLKTGVEPVLADFSSGGLPVVGMERGTDSNGTQKLTFTPTNTDIATGVYRIASSRDDRGFLIDTGSDLQLSRNRYKTTEVEATSDNSLWYVEKQADGNYRISSLASYNPGNVVTFLSLHNGYGNLSVKEPKSWQMTFKDSHARYGGGAGVGGYDTTNPSPYYYEMHQVGVNNFFKAAPTNGNGSRQLVNGGTELNASYWEFQPVNINTLGNAKRNLIEEIKKVNNGTSSSTYENIMLFSSAPNGNGTWAADTKWYTWRNNLSGDNPNAGKYVSTNSEGTTSDRELTAEGNLTPTPADRGGMWCFVGNKYAFEIYNAAYGPAFVLAKVGNDYQMVYRASIPSGAVTIFSSNYGSTIHPGVALGYGILANDNPNTGNHTPNGNVFAISGDEIVPIGGAFNKASDAVSFRLQSVSNDVVNALPEYDIYLANASLPISYTGGHEVFGNATGSPFLILEKGGAAPTADEAFGEYSAIADIVIGTNVAPYTYLKTIGATKRNAAKFYYRTEITGHVPDDFHHLSQINSASWHKVGTSEGYYEYDAQQADFPYNSITALDASDAEVADVRKTAQTVPSGSIFSGIYTVRFPGFVIHRPNGNLVRAEINGYDGSSTNTVGTQTPRYKEVTLADASTVKLQHTGTFEITHFVAPGETRQMWMPSTSSSNNGATAKIVKYMRWYNYNTARQPESSIVNLAADLQGNINNAYYYTNGVVFGSEVNGVYPKRYVNVTLPSTLGADDVNYEYTLAADVSQYTDFQNNFTPGTVPTNAVASILGPFADPNGLATGSDNFLEPTVGNRLIYHVRSAHEMAQKLTACTGTKWLEEETINFPERGVNWANYEDVVPLEYNFIDYWAYNASSQLVNVKNDNTTIETVLEDPNGTNITVVTKNNNGFLAGCSGTFVESANDASREAGHYISFDYPDNGIIPMDEGQTQKSAVLKVYLNVNGTRYNLKKFTLVFQKETEAVPYYEILGNTSHARSDQSLANQFGTISNPEGIRSELSFVYEHPYAIGQPNAALQEGNGTFYYAFPYNFDEISYSYFAASAQWADWGEYGIRHSFQASTSADNKGWFNSINYLRKLYKRKAALQELSEAEALRDEAIASTTLTDQERDTQLAEAEYRMDEANKILGEVSVATLQESYNNSFCVYADASEQPGVLGRLRINEPLCTGTRIYGTAWLSCATSVKATSPDPASVIFRFKGVRADGTMETIYSYCPGQISNIGRNKDRNEVSSYQEQDHNGNNYWQGLWQQVAFSFVNTHGAHEFTSFVLEIYNNCRGSSGGDIVLDDIRLYTQKPAVKVDNAAPICGNELSIVRISTNFDSMLESLGGNEAEALRTYYGVYAMLDKGVYDKHLASIASPTTSDVAEAFNLALMGNPDKAQCTIDGKFLPEMYAFHTIKFFNKFENHNIVSYADLVSGNILENAGRSYSYNEKGEIVGRNLVFNCRISDERMAGKPYYIVFKTNLVEQDMSAVQPSEYADFFSMGDDCRVISEFSATRAKMVKVEGAEEVDPYRIDYCPGTAPTIGVKSYGYDIKGELIQEHGVYYDWYMGKMTDFHKEVVPLGSGSQTSGSISAKDGHTDEEFCMYHCLMNFRYFYPSASVKELNDGMVVVRGFEFDPESQAGYELTQNMIDKLKEWTAADKLRLHLTGVNVDLSVSDELDLTYVVAIQKGAKVRYAPEDTEKKFPILYCMDPVEISFRTNLEAPSSSVGMSDINYEDSPYDRDKTDKSVLHSLPLRVNMAQIRDISESAEGVQLRIPLRVINPSGYFKEDNSEGTPEVTDKIHLSVDDADNDIVVAETNDPYWEMRHVDEGGGEYLPAIGKLRNIDANLRRVDGVDYLWMDFNDETIDKKQRFLPREGYYYILRTSFVENLNDDATLSSKYDLPKIKCKGNILIPVKVVPEYIVWTGAESSDWNNDRNWRRADYREIVPSEAQNLNNPYSWYRGNEDGSAHGSMVEAIYGEVYPNGMAKMLNDTIPMIREKNKDLYIPMDYGTTPSIDNRFAYAPMHETNVIIPAGATNYPVLKAHAKSTTTGSKGLLVLDNDPQEKNTPWISQDMVAYKIQDGAKPIYSVVNYFENDINNITFLPGSALENAHLLNYQKAWVEYSLPVGQWSFVSSPLLQTYAGEWFAPTANGRQETPQFQPITYSESLNNRFAPAFYQRGWDKAEAKVYRMAGDGMWQGSQNPYNVAVQMNWSNVYNDVKVDYSTGGFSVKPVMDGAASVLVRMPKDDASYKYYNADGTVSGHNTDIAHGQTQHHRLFSDKLAAQESFTQTLTNSTASNRYFLVGNPFVADMDMVKFFDQNGQFERKFWVMDAATQSLMPSVAIEGESVVSDGAKLPSTASCFVVLKSSEPSTGSTTVRYNRNMQCLPSVSAPSRQENCIAIAAVDGEGRVQSRASVFVSEDADDACRSDEDAELLLNAEDGVDEENLVSVFTMAGNTALSINCLSEGARMIPLGVVAPNDRELSLSIEADNDNWMVYDAVEKTTTPLTQNVRVSGTSLGRYFLVSSARIDDGINEGDEDDSIYSVSGIRLNSTGGQHIFIKGGKTYLKR